MERWNLRMIFKHVGLGLLILGIGLAAIGLLALARKMSPIHIPDLWVSALLSIPVTLICMGIFSVLYEYFTRVTFEESMRSQYSAWKTGVTVFPIHRNLPSRENILKEARQEVRLMSTSLARYFIAVDGLVDEKLTQGVKFKIIIYKPESQAVDEKAAEESVTSDLFRHEIQLVCETYLGPLVKKHPGKIEVKFCSFNVPFSATIIDDEKMVLSLHVYGLSRSNDGIPCLIIDNILAKDSVFKLYKNSFETIWKKLEGTPYPESIRKFFPDANQDKATSHLINNQSTDLDNIQERWSSQHELSAQTYRYVLDFLASDPTPEQIAAFGPTPQIVERTQALVAKEKAGQITPAEKAELDDYERIEHLVVMAKAGNLPYLNGNQ